MSTQNRSSVIDSSGEWAPAQAILGHTDVHPSQHEETTQPEPYEGVDAGVAPNPQPGPTVVPLHNQHTPFPARHGDGSPQFGLAYPLPPHSASSETSLPSPPAAPAWWDPSRTRQPLIGRQHSQSYPTPAPYLTNTPTQRMTTSPPIQPFNSRSPIPLGPSPPHRENPQLQPRNVSQPFQQPYSGTDDPYHFPGGSASQPYQPATYGDPSPVELPHNRDPQTYRTPSSQPFMTGRTTAMRPHGSRKTDGFVANDPFRISNDRTWPHDADVPPSYDDIPVENNQYHQGPWPAWRPNNHTSPYPYLPSQTSPYPYIPSQQLPSQQPQAGSASPDSYQLGGYPAGVESGPYLPPRHYHAPLHHGSTTTPQWSAAPEPGDSIYPPRPYGPIPPPQAVFEPGDSTTYPPATTPDPWNGNITTPLDPPQSQSRPPSPTTAESFPWRYTPGSSPWQSMSQNPYYYEPITPAGPSTWSRVRNYLLQPFRYTGKLQVHPVVSWDIEEPDLGKAAINFMSKTAPRQVYLLMLLYLPSLYFSRVARIFEEADLSLPEIKKMALETATEGKSVQFATYMTLEAVAVPPAYQQLKVTWEGFIDSVMREWKTFNIISVLLLSAILTILQIQSAADDPVTRSTALFSLICALISLLFGCMYIIRFGTMRKTYKAAEWALEAKRTKTVIWWNVWVLLAMPAIWLTWSLILYIICIMSFVWRTRSRQDPSPPEPSDGGVLATRIIITIVFGVGLIYGCLIASTFRRYGDAMDKAWKNRIDGWLHEKASGNVYVQPQYPGSVFSQPPPSWAYPGQASAPDYATSHYGGSEYPPRSDPYNGSHRSQSPTSTGEATRTNTLYNQTLTQHAPGNPKKAPFSFPPSPDLPPIPGSPMAAASDSSRNDNDSGSLGVTLGDRVDDGNSGHVHFRSPMVSAQASTSFTDSNRAGHPEETRTPPQIREQRSMPEL